MKKFQYKNALDAALDKKNPHIVLSLIEELIQRGTLHIALEKRNTDELNKLFEFIHYNFHETRFQNTLIPLVE